MVKNSGSFLLRLTNKCLSLEVKQGSNCLEVGKICMVSRYSDYEGLFEFDSKWG